MSHAHAVWLACLVVSASAVAGAGGPPDPVEPGAQLPDGAEAAEHWDLAAHFDAGVRLYASFLITNAGPGERTALAFGHLLRPAEEPVEFRNGRRAGRWQLSDDRRRIAIGSSKLGLGDDARHFEVDNDKRGIKIQLDFAADATARTAPPAPGGYRLALLNLATPATGSFWLEGMSAPRRLEGHVVLTHTWFQSAEAELLARRIDVASFDLRAPFFVSVLRAPDGQRWRWGVIASDGVPSPIPGLELELQEPGGDPYPIPGSIEMRGKGLDASISLGNPVLEVDPLDALPAVLRMVYSFGGRPRLLWVPANADIALKSAPESAVLRFQSEGIATLAFPDALPRDE